jgi:hypothetical protein
LSTRSRAHSIKFAFKIITVAVELKSYSNIKVINSIKKLGVVTSGRGVWRVEHGVKLGIFLLGNAGFLFGFPWWHSELVAR